MSPGSPDTPEARARERIDRDLVEAGWVIQNRDEMNLGAGRGVAIREFKLTAGHGYADYLLFVDGKAVGVLEAKPEGHTLSGVEVQAQKYSEGLPSGLNPPVEPLPFLYLSTGAITRFTNLLDPKPRSRRIFQIHRPETIAEWLAADSLPAWARSWAAAPQVADAPPVGDGYLARPSSLRGRICALPPIDTTGLRPSQIQAITNLEQSLAEDRPRALIQMATGSGKTRMAVTAAYRLIKFGGARRVLFLVDRGNLGEQAQVEFESFRTPDDQRKFDELYNVQRLTSPTIGASTKVVISTIQRLYSVLKGEAPPEGTDLEEESLFEVGDIPSKEPLPVAYNSAIPPEYFDVIFVDECHRSIYSLWRQVLEYFDAYLIGLTATPAKHTFGFFNQNLVMEYRHEEAVADGANVDFDIYRIKTKITEEGSTIEATDEPVLALRDRRTGRERWEAPDEDISYTAQQLDRAVVAKDQIRLVIRTFKERLFTEIFPGREIVPKTLIFAKDDLHAEDIVKTVREEFGEGNDFCQKITYKVTGRSPRDLITDFRNRYYPRIAVTVDMIATGTDIKPIEIVMFMRSVKSRVLFEQMKGRGVRAIDDDTLRSVTRDATSKTHFVIVDAVGITETDLADTQPLERKRHVSFKALLEHVAMGGTDPDSLSSLASRLSRLAKQCDPEDVSLIRQESGGPDLEDIGHEIVAALDVDTQIERARADAGLPADAEPSDAQVQGATEALLKSAVAPLATNPKLRSLLQDIKQKHEQMIDHVSKDVLLEAGQSEEAKEKAKALTTSFEQFLADNKDEIDALQFFYSKPYAERLHYKDIKALAQAIEAPPRSWTPEKLWRAYETLDRDKVRGSGKRLLTDIVSLVRFALHESDELAPYAEQVHERFDNWMAQQANRGRQFTPEQVRWLEMIRDHVATSLEVTIDDFDYQPFVEEGGLGKASQVFGKDLAAILTDLNEALSA